MLGIVMDNINDDVKSKIIFETLNSLSDKYPCCIFANNVISLPMLNKFSIFQQIQALSHKDILIGTSLLNIQIVINSLTSKAKFLYLWEPEWLSFENFQAHQLQNIFYNPDIKVITNSESDGELIDKLFDHESITVPNWNIQQMETICQTFLN